MRTLIELYDERPLENVLGVEVFRPERVVFVCPETVAGNKRIHWQLKDYFRHRGLEPELSFARANIYDAESVLQLLRRTVDQDPDCAVDITGGTDAVLFAAGLLSAERPVPVFTYSRKRNAFFDIRNAPFAANLPCQVRFSVEDCFRMAGGSMRTGRVDNGILSRYLPDFDPFFDTVNAARTVVLTAVGCHGGSENAEGKHIYTGQFSGGSMCNHDVISKGVDC